jgi:hypothetical protein
MLRLGNTRELLLHRPALSPHTDAQARMKVKSNLAFRSSVCNSSTWAPVDDELKSEARGLGPPRCLSPDG